MAEQNKQKDEKGKVRKKFIEAMGGLTQVLGGQFLFKPTKLVPKEIMNAVQELAKEEKEKMIESFKARAIALIQKKREHDRTVAQLKKDFEKKEEESMKKFTDEANALFRDLDKIKDIEKDYFDTLMSTSGIPMPEEVQEVEGEPEGDEPVG